MLKAIHAQENRAAAEGKARAVIDSFREMKLNKTAELLEGFAGETLTFYAFPDTHWRCIRTNNPLERIIREIRRRTPFCPKTRSLRVMLLSCSNTRARHGVLQPFAALRTESI